MSSTIITFQKAIKVYKELKLGSYVIPKGGNKTETSYKAVRSILQVYNFGVKDEPTNSTAVSTLTL